MQHATPKPVSAHLANNTCSMTIKLIQLWNCVEIRPTRTVFLNLNPTKPSFGQSTTYTLVHLHHKTLLQIAYFLHNNHYNPWEEVLPHPVGEMNMGPLRLIFWHRKLKTITKLHATWASSFEAKLVLRVWTPTKNSHDWTWNSHPLNFAWVGQATTSFCHNLPLVKCSPRQVFLIEALCVYL